MKLAMQSASAKLRMVVTVETVFVQLVQVDIVEAGSAVNDQVIDDETFQMQHAKQLPRLGGDAINRDFYGMQIGLLAIPCGITIGFALADAATLGSVPVDQDAYISAGLRCLAAKIAANTSCPASSCSRYSAAI
jgi:hypothetical protein